MLDDSQYREFQSLPYFEQLERSTESVELRETLLINEIFKCGKDIFGENNEEEHEDASTLRMCEFNTLEKKPSQSKYIYQYDYGKEKPLKTENIPFDDYSADEISFTLSNEDNPRKSSKESHISPNSSFHQKNSPNHITWKHNLIEDHRLKNEDNTRQYLSEFIQNNLQRSSSNEKVGKWKKSFNSQKETIRKARYPKSKESSPEKIENESSIKLRDTLYKKIFDLSQSKLNYFPDSVKKRKSIFPEKTSLKVNPYLNYLNYSTNYPQEQSCSYQTPEKNRNKKIQIPLSDQITKNVYGRLKEEVSEYNFINKFETEEKKTQEQSEEIWKNFINRSEKWIEKKKSHMIEREAMEKYQPNFLSIKQKDENSPNKQYFEYADMKYQEKVPSKNLQMKFEEKKFQPEYTFRNKKREESSKSPKKKESSVENCINKLKIQTELLKVKLLSPLKNQMEDREKLGSLNMLNESESKKLVRKFSSKEENEFNKIVKDHSGFIQLKNLYGNCIGDQRKREIHRY